MHRPRHTKPDGEFSEAIVRELERFRDVNDLRDCDVAARLGVSKPTFSKYLHRNIEIGGQVLARAFTELGIVVTYRGKRISAQDFPSRAPALEPVPPQVSFVFDQPCLLEETDGHVAITVARKEADSSSLVVAIKVAS